MNPFTSADQDKRLRAVIRNGESTQGHKFAYWFGQHYVLIYKNHVELWHSPTCNSKPDRSNKIAKGERNASTYAVFAEIIGI